ncbi:hypothetical protein HPP92_018710 [Vanilla planifolia]|uniref:Protein kinase domain-containing protein n=1 Tax=Vanilla planifolia TaxID=51239 RepID=A0A835QAC5_VANPL|nr:hypothetical protein HPP92_018710 [Vanilla planifolia]
MKSFSVLTFDEQEIIEAIKQENLIGKGGSGTVYHVVLCSGNSVAVKHIGNSPDAAAGFDRGGTAALLRRSSLGRSREFEAESMGPPPLHRRREAGIAGLGRPLRNRSRCRPGLEYLHHGCERPILHRDVKSSNILLDEDLQPRIADFGLAKILHHSTAVSRDASSHVITGTYGYIAPEYAYTWKVNDKSDVYSFGVVLMELVTGRRPVDVEYGQDKDIVRWVAGSIRSRESVAGVVDRRIVAAEERAGAVLVLRISLLCTAEIPARRPSMRNVVKMLEDAGIHRAPPRRPVAITNRRRWLMRSTPS